MNSYLIDYEKISNANIVGYLYVLLSRDTKTYLCRYHKPVVTDSKTLTVRHFLETTPVPFEDVVNVKPNSLDSEKLNRILEVKTVQRSAVSFENFCSVYENTDQNVQLNPKRRYLDLEACDDQTDSFKHFVRTQIDLACKESIRSFIRMKYFKVIHVRQNRKLWIPKDISCSFIRYDEDLLAKLLLEDTSEFAVASNNPKLDFELRKISYLPRFNFSSVYRNNSTDLLPCEDQNYSLVFSDGCHSILVSESDEILGSYRSLDKLAQDLRGRHIKKLYTNHPAVRRSTGIQMNRCIPSERRRHLRRVLKTVRCKFFFKQRFLMNKGVVYLNKSRLPDRNQSVYIHDFTDFYASVIGKTFEEESMRNVFVRLMKGRKSLAKMKSIITGLFGMSKWCYPKLFHRTLNETVHVMWQTYRRNKSAVFGMCKDSFFSTSKQFHVPIPGYRVKLEHQLKHFNMKAINSYCGIDERSGNVVIKGLQNPGFSAPIKITKEIFRFLTQRGGDEKLDLPSIIQRNVGLNETDFQVCVPKNLKPSDYFYFGTRESNDLLYCTENEDRLLYNVNASRPSVNLRPKRVLGKVDVRAYIQDILTTIVRFARTFGYIEDINESMFYEIDLFLQNYIRCKIFERTKECNLPGFKLHECQLVYPTNTDHQQ